MKNTVVFIIMLMACTISSQQVLTLDDAKSITLANNFGIQIARNNVELAENLTDKKVNGYLPTVALNGGLNGSLGGSNQKFSSGTEASTTRAFNWGGNASVDANYTIFDKRRDITLQQLKESLNLSNLELRQTIEQNLLQVYNGYYQIAQLSENLLALEEAIDISKDRMRRSEFQLELGQGNGLSVLNAKVDIQRDSVNILNAKTNLANAKRNLNVVMGRASNTEFTVEPNTTTLTNLDLEELLALSKDNIAQQINHQNIAVNELNLELIKAENRPTLFAGASYNLTYSDNASGSFIDVSNSRGLNANVGVSWTIFDGSRNIRKQNAELGIANQKLLIDQLQLQLDINITNAWALYENALFVLAVEEDAVTTNRENFERTEEQFRSGRLTSIEFRQAQLNLLTAETSLTQAKLDVKLREIELMQLAGILIE